MLELATLQHTKYTKPFGTWQFGKICVLVNVIIHELNFCKIAQFFCLSVSLLKENWREMRENIKHKIWTLMVSKIAPCPFSLCRFPWKLGPLSLCRIPGKLGPFPGKLAACRKGWCTADRGWCGGKGGALLRPGDGLLYLKNKKYFVKKKLHENNFRENKIALG